MALRIGILGAAKIVPSALLEPAKRTAEVEVVAIAARDFDRATRFANRHGIPKVHRDYEALIADPTVDAIYNPLPNSLHAEWTIRALEAGKHVLCEKPLAANADEAALMARTAERTGLVLSEAFAYRHHPLAARLREILDSGVIGRPLHFEATFEVPIVRRGDIRWRFDLAGGATMDAGCYAISLVRYLAGAEPEVVAARASGGGPKIDGTMTADLEFPDGSTGHIRCALLGPSIFRSSARITGDAGWMVVVNPYHPHWFHWLVVRGGAAWKIERVKGNNVYLHQLKAFARAVRGEAPVTTTGQDAIKTMRVVDQVYRKAGMEPRGT